jgi:hypothetical protein
LFIEEQGHKINNNILYQDNKRAILLEINGKKSSRKRTQALKIWYFFLTNPVEKENVTIVYCPTDGMSRDFHVKPLHGKTFCKFQNVILGCEVY